MTKDTKDVVHLDELEMDSKHRQRLCKAMVIALVISLPTYVGIAAFIGWLINL
jgi:type III secretory pathway component EscS